MSVWTQQQKPKSPARVSPQAPAYAELQVTTNFTFLTGGSHAEDLVATAKALGLGAIAVTDRNTLSGAARMHLAAEQAGLRLVVGARLELEDAGAPGLLCFPTNRAAYGRLSSLLTLGQRRAEKGQCRLTLTDVAAHAEGQIFVALPPKDFDWRQAIATEMDLAEAEIIPFPAARSHGALQKAACGDVEVMVLQPTGAVHAPSSAQAIKSSEHCQTRFAAKLRQLRKTLAPARLYLAASHVYRGEDRARLAALASLAAHCRTPLMATNDVLYHAPHRRRLQDVLTAIREKCTVAQGGLRFEANAERHLKSPREMGRLMRGYEDAVARTMEIVEACRFSLRELVYEYPDEPVPPGKTPHGHLVELTADGAKWRYPDGVPRKIADTIGRELALIAELNYAPYFLTVHDIVQFARAQGILCQGRGSAANSAVCYCLGITSVNPAEVDLLFERFISPERKEPPDIDVDFEHERREEVIQYIYARYGRERAGLAATVICYRARSAVRETGKAMGLSEDTVAALSGMVWGTRPTPGKGGGVLPEKHVREAGLDPNDPRLARTLELTQELMNFPRHLSQHVGGFVLTRGPLSEVVPIGNAAMPERTNIEWDKDDLDAMGLLKVDVLGLGMLTCIRKGFDLLRKHHGRDLSLGTVPRDDPAVYDMLCAADSVGVFQVESRAQMNMLPRLKPRCFYDLVIEVAIVRPGPIQGDMVHPYLRRRDGLEPEDYPSPSPEHGPPDELRQILGKTKGVPLFQEQAMRIAMEAAKFSAQEANELRRAMATFRRKGTIGLLEEKMVTRMVARGYTQDFAQRCFNQIKGFGDYGFPESHAASFALLVYVSAWLKCHYPAVFAAALLNSQPMGFYAPAQIVRDAREHGVQAREADVSHSDWDSTLEADGRGGWALRLGLRQVDGLREDDVARLLAARGAQEPVPGSTPHPAPYFGASAPGGHLLPKGEGEDGSPSFLGRRWCEAPACLAIARRRPDEGSSRTGIHPSVAAKFGSIEDLRQRSGVPVATLERLAAADAFRSLGLDRRQALWDVRALPAALPLPLFGWAETREFGEEAAVALPAMPLSEHVVNDYQTLRLSLKAHPMSFLRSRFKADGVASCDDLRKLADGVHVSLAGVILVRQRPGTAKGVVFMTLEDETGVSNAVVWPQLLERYRKVVMGARLILIRGRVQRHENIIHLVAEYLEDRSAMLQSLAQDLPKLPIAIANADEVLRPQPGSARSSSPLAPSPSPPGSTGAANPPPAARIAAHDG